MFLNCQSLISEEVLECILLDEIILFVDVYILHLLLSWNKMMLLLLFNCIVPDGDDLGQLISGVCVIPVGELWSNHEGEMTSLNQCQVETEEILVMEDHTTDPFVMRPSSHS